MSKILKEIIKSGGKELGKSLGNLKKLLKSSSDDIESFEVNVLLPKDKRSINEILKEDGAAGAKRLEGLLKEKKPKLSKIDKLGSKGEGNTRKSSKKFNQEISKEIGKKLKKRENKIKRDSLSPEERGDFSGPEFFPPSGKMAKGGIVKKKKSMGTKWENKWG